MKQKILLVASLVLGLLIAYIDSRPTWDDTGITVFALLAGGGIIGLLVQKRPWLFALAFGLWIPLWGVVVRHDLLMSDRPDFSLCRCLSRLGPALVFPQDITLCLVIW